MSDIHKAMDIIPPGSSAIVLFTRGNLTCIDLQAKSGHSGDWKVAKNRKFDKVIVYFRVEKPARVNSIYMGNFDRLEGTTQNDKYEIHFDNVSLV